MTIDKVDTKNKIQDVAERLIVQGGYGAFSFRDIAEEVGIKSASVHYHYPTKGDLAAAVMVRYTEVFSRRLPDPNDETLNPNTMLNGFIDGFKAKIVDHHNMSLCTMLTADKHRLPEAVSTALADFYQVKLEWLTQVFMRFEPSLEDQAKIQSIQFLAALHGASVLVQATDNAEFFEKAMSCWRKAHI
ncbi:TetR/AcrR family transcriptional regulator [Marinomonas transparens]|uniref:TetR/AcrR family transcriptional regulator n=1 Tax=Marinomonas transparens TaxID=2795388 RepID=A0A934JRZ4_9GAMM|nr:TetR/AcrR family transcriptional regulator [Marinomonas transparens]MBJ7536330.1 TetR/AcrR family transcriptional regulator [Marinomonas transparens]